MEQDDVGVATGEEREGRSTLATGSREVWSITGYVGRKLRACKAVITHTVSLTPGGDWGR